MYQYFFLCKCLVLCFTSKHKEFVMICVYTLVKKGCEKINTGIICSVFHVWNNVFIIHDVHVPFNIQKCK